MFSGMATSLVLILVLTLVDATTYRKRSHCVDLYDGTDGGSEFKSDPSSFEQLYNADPNPFVNCSSFFASVNISSNPTTNIAPIGTGGAGLGVNRTSSTDSAICTSVSFEDYWCANWAYSYSADPGADGASSDAHNHAPFFPGLNDSSKEFCHSLEKANYSSWVASATRPSDSAWSPTITSPCCNPFCEVQVSAVQMFFWPTPAPVSNITTFVGPDGFTYTSPSVYLVYKGISATGDCGTGGPGGTIGSSHASLTLSYAQSDIKSYVGGGIDAQNVDFAQLFPNCSLSSFVAPNFLAGTSIPDSVLSSMSSDQIHCHPVLAYNAGLQDADPAWAKCNTPIFNGAINGVYDPPRTLGPGTGLVLAPTSSPSVIASVTLATPASSLSPPLPEATTPPSTHPAVTGPRNDPPQSRTMTNNGPTSDSTVDPLPLQSPNRDPTEHLTTESAFVVTIAGGNTLPAVVIDPSSVVVDPSSVIVAGSTIDAGASAAQIQGQKISVDPAAASVIVDRKTQAISPSKSPSMSPANDDAPTAVSLTTTVAGHIIQVLPASSVVLTDGESVTQGGVSLSLPSTPVTLDSAGTSPLGSPTIQHLNPALPPSHPSRVVIVDGHSVTQGGDLIVISRTPIALDANGGLILGSSTIYDLFPSPSSSAPITAGNHPVTVLPNGVTMDSNVLTPGVSPVTVSGTPISLGQSDLLLGTSSISVSLPPSPLNADKLTTINGQAVDLLSNGISIGGKTLTPNAPAITISGTPVSLADSSMLVIATMTTSLPSLTPMPTIPGEGAGSSSLHGIGGFILSGLNGGFPTPSTAGSGGSNQTQNNTGDGSVSAKPFLGSAERIGLEWGTMGFIVMTVLTVGLGQNLGRI